VLGDHGQDVPLLLAHVLAQDRGRVADHGRQLPALDRIRAASPPRRQLVDPVQRRLECRVLLLHAVHEVLVQRRALQQQRPDQVVLGLVMVVQRADDVGQVLGQYGGTRGVTRAHAFDQVRQQVELPPEHPVHHDHRVGVGFRACTHRVAPCT
jgi:hypothetical protein